LAWNKLAQEENEQQLAVAAGLSIQESNTDDNHGELDAIEVGLPDQDSDDNDANFDFLDENSMHHMDEDEVDDLKVSAIPNKIRASFNSTQDSLADTSAGIEHKTTMSAAAENVEEKKITDDEVNQSDPPSVVDESMNVLMVDHEATMSVAAGNDKDKRIGVDGAEHCDPPIVVDEFMNLYADHSKPVKYEYDV